MTIVKYYQNSRNGNKYIEVHNDGHYHNTVRQFCFWRHSKKCGRGFTLNYTGDGVLHRWRRANLNELLTDYAETSKPF